MNLDKERQIAQIISRRITGIINGKDDAILDGWLAASEYNRAIYGQIMSDGSGSKRRESVAAIDLSAELRAVQARARKLTSRRHWVATLSGVAAAVIVITAIFTFNVGEVEQDLMALTPLGTSQATLTVGNASPVYLSAEESDSAWSNYVENGSDETSAVIEPAVVKIAVPNGSEFRLLLPDGTQALLNSESSIEYPSFFDGENRVVTLRGEAYFEVRRDEARPFVVNTGMASVTVLGTSFNISAYADDDHMTTTLLTGEVEICTGKESVLLTPDKQAVISRDSHDIVVRNVNAKSFMAWTTGTLEFQNMRLEDICARLSRWYGVSFQFLDDSADECFTGAIWKYKPLGELLRGIEMVTDVSFRHDGDKITISHPRPN